MDGFGERREGRMELGVRKGTTEQTYVFEHDVNGAIPRRAK